MREPSRDKGRLEDILEAARNIAEFGEGIDFPSFQADKLRYFAVLKNVEIIGEAAYMLSLEYKEQHNDIPWDAIIRMRHVLVHGYAEVIPEVLWQTAVSDVPILQSQVEELVQKWDDATSIRLVPERKENVTHVELPTLPKNYKVSDEILRMNGTIQLKRPTPEEFAADPRLAYLWEKYVDCNGSDSELPNSL